MLKAEQVSFFNENGFLVAENLISRELLSELRADFTAWVDESKLHEQSYGTTLDGRPRFDLEPGHSAATPALRRVASPGEISEVYKHVMLNGAVPTAVAQLIGPNVKLHHAKINSKLPGTPTKVKWHQDFPFTPHTNDDLITALVMLDDLTEQNGPLEVVPGTHKDPICSLWHNGIFTGSVTGVVEEECHRTAVRCHGTAGSVCFMHTRLLHGSAPNLSNNPRTLFIVVYAAEDAIPLAENPLPSIFDGQLVYGVETGKVRCIPFEIELPEKPKGASFFTQQVQRRD